MSDSPEKRRPRLVNTLIETFGFSPLFASIVALILVLLVAGAIVWIWLSAPPRTVTITTGPEGSSFQRYAEAYQKDLADDGLTLRIVPSSGSLDNLKRLQARDSGVDIGFVQGGLVDPPKPPGLISLGSVAVQPLWVFYRGTTRFSRLSELAGKRIGIGVPGSGTHALATALLQANGITGAPSTLVEQDAENAATDLLANKLDAVFLMGEAAPIQTLRTLIRTPDVQLFNFVQADAYVRRLSYLNKISLPQGSIDFGLNLPSQDVMLVGPAIELVAKEGLNSAVSDIMLEVAKKTHERSGLLSRRGEFPAPLDRDFTLSDDALRYYKSGLGFTYRKVQNFWLASLVNRLLVVIVPLILVIVPMIRLLPIVYRWSVQLKIYRCYRPLLRLEREAQVPQTDDDIKLLQARLDQIEKEVNALKVPASFAYQFYALRGHVAFVRNRLKAAAAV
jgi:TRAP-type uncharacterized transport system substrate-binding protein